MIPDKVISDVLDIDILRIFEGEGFEPAKAGNGRKVVCCPFHNEKTPSLSIDSAKNLWHCFGCGEGGNGIGFIMKLKGFTFPEAVRYLAKRNNIYFEEKEMTPEEKEAQFHRDKLYTVNGLAHEFFRSKLNAPIAVDYLKSRGWDPQSESGKHVIGLFGLGYAPKGNQMMEFFRKKGWTDMTLLEEAGLIGRNEETREPYDFFRNRLIFPIFNSTGQVVGFSGRDVTGEQYSKYVNTRETPVYSKSRTLFGWTQSLRRISTERRVVLVEGNPDVMRLHEIGIDYAVAPLGTAFTNEQISLIAKKAATVIIVGDRDAVKPGQAGKDLPGDIAVIDHGRALTQAGLNVQVMTLPQDDPEIKVDADSYFEIRRRKSEFDELLSTQTMDYIPWMAERLFTSAKSDQEKAAAIVNVCQLLSHVRDENIADMYYDSLTKKYKNNKVWNREYSRAKGERERETKVRNGDQDMVTEYGFYVSDSCYYSAQAVRWSNFIMRPILHIRDEKNARRIFELENSCGQSAVIKMNQSELVSFSDFRTRTETAGNFIWEAGQGELTCLKKYLYKNTPSADEIRQMGWQKKYGFYAWGNGGFDEMNNFVKADKFGIIEINGRKFYLPGYALDTADNTTGYQQQRKFVYIEANDISLQDFAAKLVQIFGDNAKVGLCYLFATLFKDIVITIAKFPILNLFGPKGSGKTALAHALSSFFRQDDKAPNINNMTRASLAEAIAESSNAIVHIDEYKNGLETEKIEILKGIWDGVGRTRLNMDDKKSRETTPVDCGVILSGQEAPSADNALLNRLVYLTFSRTVFSDSEKRNLEVLETIENRGLTHLTRQILACRPKFAGEFRQSWEATMEDMNERLRSYGIEDRTLKNWAVVLSSFRAIESYLHMPFTYSEMLDICCRGCMEQNQVTKSNNEISGFWSIFDSLISSSKCWYGVDYKIKFTPKPKKFMGSNEYYQFESGKRYLFLNFNRPSMLYGKEVRESGSKGIPRDTLKYYLEHSREYIGTLKSERFYVIDTAGGFVRNGGNKSKPYMAMVFDYDLIEEIYGISLEVSTNNADEDEQPSSPYPEYDGERLPYEEES